MTINLFRESRKMKHIKIFEDTQKMCMTDPVIRDYVERSNTDTQYYRSGYFSERRKMLTEKKEYDPKNVIVVPITTGDAVYKYANKPKTTCVLNFASATHPGGKVEEGANAQEECLCRQSTLYRSINTPFCIDNYYCKNKYNIRKTGSTAYDSSMLWNPHIVFFKDDVGNLLDKTKWVEDVNVITCAAPNLRHGFPYESHDQYQKNLEDRIHSIIACGKNAGMKTFILGAWGCGVFLNKPEDVALAFKHVITEEADDDLKFIFAIIAPNISSNQNPNNNYEIFKSILSHK